MTGRYFLKVGALLVGLLLGASSALFAQEDSPTRFVRAFYDWYVPLALKDKHQPSFAVAIRARKEWFDPELAAALEEDAQAQAKVTGDVVGIDFDPFLNAQDPAAKYYVGTGSRIGEGYRVPVYSAPTHKAGAIPDVVVLLKKDPGGWRMINFEYPEVKSDLKNSLRLLRQSREKDRRRRP
jgi:hypothetical protein